MPEERFWESTPQELEPYAAAQKMRQQSQIELMNLWGWLQGQYFREAIASSVFTADLPETKRRLPAYPKKPYEINTGDDAAGAAKPLSEEEIEMARLQERIKMDNLCRAIKEHYAKRG